MKYLKLILAFFVVSLNSCKKESTKNSTASLTIINAVVGSNPLVTNFSNSYELYGYYKNALQVNYGAWSTNYQLGAYSGTQPLRLYQMPDTTDKSVPFYSLNLNLPAGSIRTLFLIGTITQHDTLLTLDNPPYHAANDSSVGIRFINLSPGANPVNITLSTSATTNQFAGVAYKGVTSFKNYPAIKSVSSYTFQIRDAATNAIIASQTLSGINNGTGTNTQINQYRFRNITILLIGQPGGTGSAASKALVVNNY